MHRPSAHHGCGAYPGVTGTFFFWGQPLRHLFLNFVWSSKSAALGPGTGGCEGAPITDFVSVASAVLRISRMDKTGESPMLLPTTLSLAAAAAIINLWLSIRCGQVRGKAGISIGTGGNDLLERRMRAQLNFAENTPWVLFLVAGIELAGKGGQWLAIVGGLFMLGRVAHGLGMDGAGATAKGRMVGTLITMLTLLGLAVVAVLIALGRM